MTGKETKKYAVVVTSLTIEYDKHDSFWDDPIIDEMVIDSVHDSIESAREREEVLFEEYKYPEQNQTYPDANDFRVVEIPL